MFKEARPLLLPALVLGLASDLLFYGKAIGISGLLFTALSLAALVLTLRFHGRMLSRSGWSCGLGALFFATLAALRASPALTVLNVGASFGLLAYAVFFAAAGSPARLGLVGAALLPWRVAGLSALAPLPLARESIPGFSLRRHGRLALSILRGLLLSLPVLLVFLGLFMSADVVFAAFVEDLWQLDFLADLARLGWRSWLIVVVAWLAAGALTLAPSRTKADDERSWLDRAIADLPRHVPLGFTETTIILTSVNVLFLTFILIQITYLFGGVRNIAIDGYTYAEYARQGFFELVVVAVLALSLLLALDWLSSRDTKGRHVLFTGLSSVSVLSVGVMLLSAWQRMRLYQSAYGFTETRLTVTVFMAWLAGLLFWFLWCIWRRHDGFVSGFILVGAGFLATLNLLGMDTIIVRQNLARYAVTGDLDVAYLTTLSDDAVPALAHALAAVAADRTPVHDPGCARESKDVCLTTRANMLHRNLLARQMALAANPRLEHWPAFNLARWRATRVLNRLYGPPSGLN